ncbi:MAG: RNA pseudouridine synthase [Bacilli bacterium]
MKQNAKAPFSVLYEDGNMVAVYKKQKILSVATDDEKTFHQNLLSYLRKDLHFPVYLVHRLDYETSGVMVFAKDVKTQNTLKDCFEKRTVKREYEAVVKEEIPAGKVFEVKQLLEESKNGTVTVVDKGGKEAITRIVAGNRIQIGTALHIEIETGRKNQIRLALQSLGLTLVGDPHSDKEEAKRMYLNGYRLSFPKDAILKQDCFETKPLWLIEQK